MPQEAISHDAGRDLLAGLLSPVLTHLAVGDAGVPLLDGGGLPLPGMRARTGLNHELGRAAALVKHFVVPDPTGAILAAPIPGGTTARYRIVTEPTNLVYVLFRFLDAQALGAWNEYGLFAGDVAFVARAGTLVNGPQAGDDRAGVNAILAGVYTGVAAQTLTVTVTTGGGSGVAKLGWVSSGAEAAAVNQTVTFGTPVVLGGTGLTLLFTNGGTDSVLTVGDQFLVRCTAGAVTASFAADGMYDPLSHEAGQVLRNGSLMRSYYVTPAEIKGATTVDVQLVVAVLNQEAA
jgi:hypothetical protein